MKRSVSMALALACAVSTVGCSGGLGQAAAVTDAIVIPWAALACEVIEEKMSPPPHGWVDIGCTALEKVDASLTPTAPAASATSMSPPASTGTPIQNTAAQIRLRVTVPQAKDVASRYPRALRLPAGL